MTPAQLQFAQTLLIAVGGLAVAFAVVRMIGANWLRALFESEGAASIRLVLAAAIGFGTLYMQATGRINGEQASINYTCVSSLLLIGSARIAAKAFAQRPATPATQIKTDKTEVAAAGDANIYPAAHDQPPA